MKINKDKFIKLVLFKENECKALEEYLEEKALKGWILEDRSAGFFVFKIKWDVLKWLESNFRHYQNPCIIYY